MCGIAGALSLREGVAPPSREDLAAMVGALRHRGPDERGLYRDGRVGLAHARLSIIDLAGGQQPLCNEDGTRWIVFNGEIFNYVELREELVARGHHFRTRSDTEVLLHAWEAFGPRCFERFNGQFAVALWDAREGTLVLARDRLGVRPLHLCEHGGRLWFASEVKAIFAGAPAIPRELDPAGLAETFTFWTAVAPQGVFRGVRELEPGHVRVVGPRGATERAFWTPRYPARTGGGTPGSLAEAVDRTRASLQAAVRLRMLRADVPVGSYLSGGLDSSLVAAMGRRAKDDRFFTFSIRFEDAEFDETHFQRQVAARIGSEHRDVVVRRRDIAEAFPDVVRHAERPLLRTAPAPLFLLSRLVRDAGIKVVLTGEGADEMFGGYDLFREARVRRFWARAPGSRLRPRLLERLYPWLARSPVAQQALAREFFGRGLERAAEPGFGHMTRWGPTAALWRLFSPALRGEVEGFDPVARLLATLPAEFSRWSPLAQDQYLEVRTLLSGYLLSSQGDRMLMAHSVEGRFPYLDTELVELANALPPDFKLRGLDEKHVLKRVAEGWVPASVVRRSKQPYRAPDARCFTAPDAPAWVADLMDERAVTGAGLFDPRAVARLWRKCREAREDAPPSNADNMAVVGVLSTGLLHEQLVRRAPTRESPGDFRTVVDRLAPPGAARGPAGAPGERGTT
ncbi:MAG TPA: asparagine synthase (glutamine-hydrolyzing) [Anaeromyxobacteraceae bacterium]|nr:asparagine synthase (glutamine-hydrolyzing) [Anaeromyxobacteraceae bacterium]